MNRRPNPAAEHLRSGPPEEFFEDRKQALEVREAIETEKARRWLEENRIMARTVTGPERRATLRAYIARLKTLPKPEPRSWAYAMLSRIADGEILSPICDQWAREVVAMGKETEQRDGA